MLQVWEPTDQNDGQCDGTVRQGPWGRQDRRIGVPAIRPGKDAFTFQAQALPVPDGTVVLSLDGRASGPPRAPAEWALFLCGPSSPRANPPASLA
jgi:hypothetical protein